MSSDPGDFSKEGAPVISNLDLDGSHMSATDSNNNFQFPTKQGSASMAATKVVPTDESAIRRRSLSFTEQIPYDEVSCEPGFIEVRARKANLMRLVKYIDKMDPYVVFNELWSNTSRQTKVVRDGHKHPHWDIETHNALQAFRFPGFAAKGQTADRNSSNKKKRGSQDGPLQLKVVVMDESLGWLQDKEIGTGYIDIEDFVRKNKNYGGRRELKVPLFYENKDVGYIKLEVRYLTKVQYSRNKRGGSQGSLLGVISEGLRRQRRSSITVDSQFVVMPNGSFRKYWDLITCLLLLYTALFTPVQMAFLSEEYSFSNIKEWLFIFAIDRVVDFVFFVDIFVNFRSAYVMQNGLTVFDARDVAWRYVKSWFAVDFISILPFELLEFVDFSDGTGEGGINASTLRSIKLIRLLRLLKLAKVIRASRIMKRFEANMSIKFGWIRLIKFVVGLCGIAHWNACIWFMVGSIANPGEMSWISAHNLDWKERYTLGDRYAASLYWSMMTLTTIGYGDIVAENSTERIYNTLAMMICSLIFAYVVGTMCSLVQGLDVTNLEFQAMMDDINEYMHKHKVPRELRLRVRKYCLYQRDSTNHHNEQELLSFFSPALRKEVALHNYLPILEKVEYFANASTSFLTELSLSIELHVFGPNEVVSDDTRRTCSMHILTKGRAQIERTDKIGMVYIARELQRGSVFGEEALLFSGGGGNQCVRTLTFCDICILEQEKFTRIINRFPQINMQVRKIYLRKKWKEILRNPAVRSELKKLRKMIDAGKNPIQDTTYNPSKTNYSVDAEVKGGLAQLQGSYGVILERINLTASKCDKMEAEMKAIREDVVKILKKLK